jgi:cytosine/adenosine deaminase-related metal-dependent hydrolase
MNKEFSLSLATIVTPAEIKNNASIKISDGKIADFSKSNDKDYKFDQSYILFPAIINAHDHLFGTYYPKIGNGPYVCWLPWDYDLKTSDIYEERNKNSPFLIYQLGSYKNLISGVTTVHDHIPHKINDPFIDKLPIRILKNYALSHEASAYDLKWGEGIDIEHKKAVNNNIPYVTHIEEGWDDESLRGIDILTEHKALTNYTVMIHGIGFSQKDIEVVAKKKANFIWCPGSNMYMFGKTAKVKEIMQAGINTSVGTDSPASGELHILEEIRFAKKTYKQMYSEEIPDQTLVKMITVNPAKAFRLQDNLGSLEVGKLGDLLVISGNGKNPYGSLVNASLKDIALIFMEGQPLYGNVEFREIFEDLGSDFTQIKVEGMDKYIIGDPNSIMEKMRNTLGFHKELPFLPI